jgi:hypothetical protein
VSASQRLDPALAPLEEDPGVPIAGDPVEDEPVAADPPTLLPVLPPPTLLPAAPEGEVVLPAPTEGELLVPPPMLPAPVLPPVPDELWANAPAIAKSAAAVAETMSLSFMCVLLS